MITRAGYWARIETTRRIYLLAKELTGGRQVIGNAPIIRTYVPPKRLIIQPKPIEISAAQQRVTHGHMGDANVYEYDGQGDFYVCIFCMASYLVYVKTTYTAKDSNAYQRVYVRTRNRNPILIDCVYTITTEVHDEQRKYNNVWYMREYDNINPRYDVHTSGIYVVSITYQVPVVYVHTFLVSIHKSRSLV